ncbi:hypothetical protein Tco_0268487 [Tanacetum coccineum]
MRRQIAWDKVENPSPEKTPQILPSFEETTPPVTYPEEVEETLRIPMEIEPLDKTQLEELGLNTCNHDIPLSSREIPSVDEPETQPLPNFSPLDVNLGDKRGTDPPINLYSSGSFRMKLLKTLSLDESRSHEFNLFFDLEENSEEEVIDIMTENMEEYMSKTRDDYGSGIARPKIDDKDHFEIKGQFLKELRDNTFSDQVMLRFFLMSLTGAVSHWLRNKPTGSIKTWEDLKARFLILTRQILDSKGVIPAKTVADEKVAIQEMAEDYDLWSMRMEQYLTHTDYALWEVIMNGDAPATIASASAGTEVGILGLSSIESFNGIQGIQRPYVNQSRPEGLDKTYDMRFQKLISQLEIHGEVISQEDANLKLLKKIP